MSPRLRKIVIALLAGAGLASTLAAPSAQAATAIGHRLPAEGPLTSSCAVFSRGFVLNQIPANRQEPGGSRASVAGVITSWRLEATVGNVHPPIALHVYTPGSTGKYTDAGIGAAEAIADPASPSGTRFIASYFTRLSIAKGQAIGVDLLNTAPANGCIDVGTTPCPNGDDVFTPTLGAGQSATALPANECIPLSASVEPDADGDGFGDETQDECASQAATQGACVRSCASLEKKTRERCFCGKKRKRKSRRKCLRKLKAKGRKH